jgi:hypothetical protein
MALPEIKHAEAERDLKSFCEKNLPPEIKTKLRYSFKFRGNDVTLFEERPPWDGRGNKWTQASVARFRYEAESNKWSLYWQRANRRWLKCDWITPKARFRDALDEVKRDPYGAFFG